MRFWWEWEVQASNPWPDLQHSFLVLKCSRSHSPKTTAFKS
ncbi:hypothetical protein E2C01_033486 [Portunus trituberculatus]|uniref:Uncharacterized protein n=1 Tax=Portunus trituberculatus TaxID=210409 RepID=A0A5B7F4B4_PORTR|nr:hypothetical protein [Portunus trituberculatus]